MYTFGNLDPSSKDNGIAVAYISRISYYREWGTGVIYVLRNSFLTANLTPLVKEDGTYLSFEEWEDMHSIEQPSF